MPSEGRWTWILIEVRPRCSYKRQKNPALDDYERPFWNCQVTSVF